MQLVGPAVRCSRRCRCSALQCSSSFVSWELPLPIAVASRSLPMISSSTRLGPSPCRLSSARSRRAGTAIPKAAKSTNVTELDVFPSPPFLLIPPRPLGEERAGTLPPEGPSSFCSATEMASANCRSASSSGSPISHRHRVRQPHHRQSIGQVVPCAPRSHDGVTTGPLAGALTLAAMLSLDSGAKTGCAFSGGANTP